MTNPSVNDIEDEREAIRTPDAPPKAPSHWKQEDWDELKRYIRWLCDQLGLRDWEIILLHETTAEVGEGDAIAYIHPTDGQRRATLRLCSDFREMSPEKQRHSLIHELIHPHHRDATDIIRLTLPRSFGGVAYEVLWENFRQQVELMVDNIATAIAEQYPVPDWPKPKKRKEKKGKKP